MQQSRNHRTGFTLIELLTVVGIISLLISILMPSLTRARDQAKGTHCLARLHDYGTSLATYENSNGDRLPPPHWEYTNRFEQDGVQQEPVSYGWAELLYKYVYLEEVDEAAPFPVLRNVPEGRYEPYFTCKASSFQGLSSGHYRVYLPAWGSGTYAIESDGTFGELTQPNECASVSRSAIRPRLPLIGDSNEQSYRGSPDADPEQMTSYIGPGEANDAGPNGYDGNRFSDRHYGGTNYLFQDLRAEWKTRLRDDLAIDWDLNGIDDVEVLP